MPVKQLQRLSQFHKVIAGWSCAAILAFCGMTNGVAAPDIETSFPVAANLMTNGPVLTTASYGSNTGATTGHGIGLDASNGLLDPRFPKVEKIVSGPGQINVVVSDGAGGWVIGGDFDTVGGVKLVNLAHILSDFSVNSAWRPDPDGAVHALQFHFGNGGIRLLVGGNFSTIHGELRQNFAELDTASLAKPVTGIDLSIDGAVRDIEKIGGIVYIAGEFTEVRGTGPLDTNGDGEDDYDTDSDLIIDGSAGLGYDADGDDSDDAVAWTPSTDPIGYTRPLDTVSERHSYIAALDLSVESNAEVVQAWNPAPNNAIHAMEASLSGTLYVGGVFETFNSGVVTRQKIAELNPASNINTVTTWNPASGSSNITEINAIALDTEVIDETSGDETGRLFVGGIFEEMGGQPRRNFAALDISIDVNNAVPTWSVQYGSVGEQVNAIARTDEKVYVGGNSAGTEKLVVIDNETGSKIDSWETQPAGEVNALAVEGNTLYVGGDFAGLSGDGSQLYIGGDFTYIGPSTGSGVVVERYPDPTPLNDIFQTGWPEINGDVYAVESDGSGGWYIGGSFTKVGGLDRNNIAHINNAKNVTVWDPDPNGVVNAIVRNGTELYVGGDFTSFNGGVDSRGRLAKFVSDNLQAWNPDVDAAVRALVLYDDTVNVDLYVGGDFSSFNGGAASRGRLAKFIDDNLQGWDPNANGTVRAMALSGSTLFVGGDFTGIDAVAAGSRNRLAALDTTATAAGSYDTGWNPNASETVRAMALSGSTLFVGGDFTEIDTVIAPASRNRLAALDTTATVAGNYDTGWNPNANSAVYELYHDGTNLYVGGDFTFIGSLLRNRVAVLNTGTGVATAWDPSAGNTVHAIADGGTNIFIGGAFSSVGGETRERVAAIDLSSGELDPLFDVAVDGTVRALVVSNDGETLYVGGDFSSIGGQLRNGLGSINTLNGIAQNWDPDVTGAVYDMAMSEEEETLYIGGAFSEIGGQSRNNIGAVGVEDGAGTAWNPSTNGLVRTVALGSDTLYIGGDFSRVNTNGQNVTRLSLAALATATNTDNATAWAPLADGIVRDVALTGSTLYIAGDFNNINDSGITRPRDNLAAIDATANAFNVLNWNPGVVTNSPGPSAMYSIALTDDAVFVGGDFETIGSASRNRLAALDYVNGTPLGWWQLDADTPVPANSSGAVHHLGLAGDGDRMIIGGDFREITTTGSGAATYLRRGFIAVDVGFPHVVLNPPPGAYQTTQSITMVCVDTPNDCGQTVYYTDDSSDPVIGGTPAPPPLVSTNTTFKTIVEDDESNLSQIQTALYIIDAVEPETTATPQGPLPEGKLFNGGDDRNITLECEDFGTGDVTTTAAGCAEIYYTINDKADPTTEATLYTGPIFIDENTTLKYFSVDLAGNSEETTFKTEQYWVDLSAPKVFASPGTGVFFAASQEIKFLCSDNETVTESSIGDIPDADNPPLPDDPPPSVNTTTADEKQRIETGCKAIYYTLDESTPSTSSMLYTGPFTINESTVVKYIAVDHANNSGGVQRASYVKNYSDNVGATGPAWLALMLLPWVWRCGRGVSRSKCHEEVL